MCSNGMNGIRLETLPRASMTRRDIPALLTDDQATDPCLIVELAVTASGPESHSF